MRRRLRVHRLVLPLALLVAVAVGTGSVGSSGAAFTTSSKTTVVARAEGISAWINLWSQNTDPDGLTGYATQRVRSGAAPLCASGADETLTCAMGGIRKNATYTFDRVFTLEDVSPFPDSSVATVTIAYSLIEDEESGCQPISGVSFSSVGGSSRKYGVNLTLRARGGGWNKNQTYTPTLRLTMSYTGSPSGYYVYDVPVSVTIVTW